MNAATTTSRDECIANDIELRDRLVIEMLDEVRGMVSNFSYKYRMDFDDCLQHASLIMLEVYPKIPDGYNKKAYLNASIMRSLHQLLRPHIEHYTHDFSLEMERNEDGATLADVLQAPEPSHAEEASEMTEAVYSALATCRLEEQEYATMRFGLDYTPVPNEKKKYRSALKQDRRTDNLLTSIKRVFRKNPQILSLLQRETCIL